MRIFMAICCALLTVCPLLAQGDRTGATRIYRLPRFERAVRCIKFFEGWHTEIHHPYVAYGHQLQPGERYSARTMTRKQGEALLRKDLRKFCAMFRQFGKDSLLLATLAYNVGPYRLLGSNKIPKSTLIRKLGLATETSIRSTSLSATIRGNGTRCCSNAGKRSFRYCMYHK